MAREAIFVNEFTDGILDPNKEMLGQLMMMELFHP